MSEHSLFEDLPHGSAKPSEPERLPRGVDKGRVDRTRRSALWAAYGDALGFISELTDADGLHRRIGAGRLTVPVPWKRRVGGRGGISTTLPAGCYSDDTQLRLASARAISPMGFDVEAFAKVELPVWLAYALGGGVSTKAAAVNLGKTTTAWFANTYQNWFEAGGNGAAMRIQPHVWAASDLKDPFTYMIDVLRNAVCTHAHPTALVGTAVHTLALAYVMETETPASPAVLTELLDDVGMVPAMLREDEQLNELWLTGWEREARYAFADAWKAACSDTAEAIMNAERAATTGSPEERYNRVIDDLHLRKPDRRGSGILTAVAASALAWGDAEPMESLVIAANAIGSDTDTIATMAGALLGAVATDEPAVPVMDARLIAAEAERMALLAGGRQGEGHRYPDLLTWTAPKTQADALLKGADGLHVAGLGQVRRTLGEPIQAQQGAFLWQWAELSFGQTVLIKRRDQLPVAHHPEPTGHSVDRRPRDTPQMPAATDTRHPEGRRTPTNRSDLERDHQRGRRASEPNRRNQGLDLGRVIEWVKAEQGNDASIGYAMRRVANEGTPEQTAAFLAVLLDILRRPEPHRGT